VDTEQPELEMCAWPILGSGWTASGDWDDEGGACWQVAEPDSAYCGDHRYKPIPPEHRDE